MAALGSMAKAQYAAKLTIADCAIFRTWVGVDDQGESLAKIYEESLPDPEDTSYTEEELTAYRPYCMIYTEAYHRAPGSPRSEGGKVKAMFVADVGDDRRAADVAFMNFLSQLFDQLATLCTAGAAGHIGAATMIACDGKPFRNLPEEAQQYGEALIGIISISWGAGGIA